MLARDVGQKKNSLFRNNKNGRVSLEFQMIRKSEMTIRMLQSRAAGNEIAQVEENYCLSNRNV